MMNQLVHVFAEQLFRLIPKHLSRSSIDEGAVTMQIQAVNALAG